MCSEEWWEYAEGNTYIRRRNRRYDSSSSIHDFLSVGRYCLDTLSIENKRITCHPDSAKNWTDFVGEQQTDRLQRLFTSIDIVSEKQIVGLGWKATTFEVTKQIRVLSAKVAYRTIFIKRNDRESFQWNQLSSPLNVPQILIGALSSRSMGWLRKMSFDLSHRWYISCSDISTNLPGGRHSRTLKRKNPNIGIVRQCLLIDWPSRSRSIKSSTFNCESSLAASILKSSQC